MYRQNHTFKTPKTGKIANFLMFLLLSFSMITFVGCGSDSSTDSNNPGTPNNPGEPAEEQGANEVWIQGTSFNVANLEVSAGTRVTWTNKSSMEHTVTSGTRGSDDEGDLFDRDLSPGQTFSHTFEDAGSYQYFCRRHGGMSAEVTVATEN